MPRKLPKPKYTQEHWEKTAEGTRASGTQGEDAVERIFGLSEPFIEIKSCCHEYYRTVVRATQFNECLEENKVYCVVVYRRYRRIRIDEEGKRRYYFKLSIEEAFEGHIKFFFLPARDLQEVIERSKARFVSAERYDQRDSFWHIRWNSILKYIEEKYGAHTHVLEGSMPHRVYGEVPVMPKDWTPF